MAGILARRGRAHGAIRQLWRRCHAARQSGRAEQPRFHSCQQWPSTRKATGSEKHRRADSPWRQRRLRVTCCCITDTTKRKAEWWREDREREEGQEGHRGAARSCPVLCTHGVEHRGPLARSQGASREPHISLSCWEAQGSGPPRRGRSQLPQLLDHHLHAAAHTVTLLLRSWHGPASLPRALLEGPGLLQRGAVCPTLPVFIRGGYLPLLQLTHFLLESF